MSTGCTCGCCAGTSVQTPEGENNLPGLAAVAYRTGIWSAFKESMLARLSSADYPALSYLKTRDDDDFSIALIDAAAVMLDILTFYQERLANESYLRTATQLDSLTQLSRLIGYQPTPGIAASTYLAFTVRAATGLPPDPATAAITIPAGSQVQSVPAQGQAPQSFETSADILAKPDWNALPVQTGRPWLPKAGATSVYLAGTSTQLQPGDAILIVEAGGALVQLHVRLVSSVTTDAVNQRTLLTWADRLTPAAAPGSNMAVYALRQRAALFGFNAVNPLMLAKKTQEELGNLGLIGGTTGTLEWSFGAPDPGVVDLDAVYSKVVAGGWLVLLSSGGTVVTVASIASVATVSRSDYGVSAKITRATLTSDPGLNEFYTATRDTSVLVQSEQLPVAEQPLDHPLYGSVVDLEVIRTDLAGVTAIAVTGKSQSITLNADAAPIPFTPDDESAPPVSLAAGDTLTILRPPDFLHPDGSVPAWKQATQTLTLSVADTNGRSGTVTAALSSFTLGLAAASAPVVQEFALISGTSVQASPFPHTRIQLRTPLVNCYDRTVTTINANVGPATAGSSVTEVMGSGSASTANQQFTLRQSPLTYVQAPTPTGRLSTLQVRANGVAWTAVPSLYRQGSGDQVYATLDLPGGGTLVEFGDGVEGANLPTGQNNVQGSYRVGSGLAGNVAAGAITILVDRPVGVSGVTNPLPATGGQDAQSPDDIRANAPQSVLTLGRAVSITDYQDLAASFAGIAKACATWIPGGAYRGVLLTVAGAGGAALPAGNPTLANLVTALRNSGNPNVAVHAQSFLETTFRLTADIRYDPAYAQTAVQAAIMQALTQTYRFTARSFGQGVSGDEVAALIQGIAGVVAVNVTTLRVVATSTAGDIGSSAYSVSAYNAWMAGAITQPLPRPCSGSRTSICPYIPVATPNVLPLPAEILVLDPDPKKILLGVMT
ncbi:MAG: baseplate J/gp47 family protein [Streptosporangiaceae bacterium]|jgi:predicted phage baseplate assembly protein